MFIRKHFSLFFISLISLSVIFTLSACSSQEHTSQEQSLNENSEQTYQTCSEPRPQKCAMNYDPVCATDSEGNSATKSNGCSACSDKNVLKFMSGSCEGGSTAPPIKMIK